MKAKSLPALTSLRFFAATLVAWYHLYHLPVAGAYPARPIGPGAMGFIGVTFFFILSGFVLTWTWQQHESKVMFYLRRVARIYPVATLTTLGALVFYALRIEPTTFRGFGPMFFARAVACLLLVETWVPKGEFHQAFNASLWSLSNEIFFYLLFPFLVPVVAKIRARFAIVGALVWLIGLGIAANFLHAISPERIYSFPPYRLAEFVIGIAMAAALKNGAKVRLPLWAGIAIVVATYVLLTPVDALLGGLLHANRPLTNSLTAAPFAALIWSAAGHDLAGRTGFLHWKPLIKLGQWSFALYLIHDLLYRGLPHYVMPQSTVERYGYGLTALLISQILAALVYEYFERPIERAIRTRLHQRESQMAAMDRVVDGEPQPGGSMPHATAAGLHEPRGDAVVTTAVRPQPR